MIQKFFPLAIIALFVGAAYAFGDVTAAFSTAETKIDEGNAGLKRIATPILVLVMTVLGIAWMMGYFQKSFIMKVVAGAIMVGSAGTLASWVIG
jgi:hypothetical protein